MSSKANPTIIGAFVFGAIVLSVAGILIFGGGKFFTKEYRWVSHFSGSVQGLDVGAPVRFRGVRVGSVERIVARHHAGEDEIQIAVYLAFEQGSVETVGRENQVEKMDDANAAIQQLIDGGLRGQLQMDSLITGKLFVSLDFFPGTEARYVDQEKKYPEMPTVPSTFEVLAKTIENIPIEELFDNANESVKTINEILTSEEVKRILSSLDSTLAGVDKLVASANAEFEPIAEKVKAALDQATETLKVGEGLMDQDIRKLVSVGDDLMDHDIRKLVRDVDAELEPLSRSARATMDQIRTALVGVERTFSDRSELRLQIARVLEEMTDAFRAIRTFANYLERHPEALLRGKESS